MEKDCLGLDISFERVGSASAELPTKGAVKVTVEVLGNCSMEIENGDMVLSPADGENCIFDSSGCCLPLVRNLRFKWRTEGVSNPITQARVKRLFTVPL